MVLSSPSGHALDVAARTLSARRPEPQAQTGEPRSARITAKSPTAEPPIPPPVPSAMGAAPVTAGRAGAGVLNPAAAGRPGVPGVPAVPDDATPAPRLGLVAVK